MRDLAELEQSGVCCCVVCVCGHASGWEMDMSVLSLSTKRAIDLAQAFDPAGNEVHRQMMIVDCMPWALLVAGRCLQPACCLGCCNPPLLSHLMVPKETPRGPRSSCGVAPCMSERRTKAVAKPVSIFNSSAWVKAGFTWMIRLGNGANSICA